MNLDNVKEARKNLDDAWIAFNDSMISGDIEIMEKASQKTKELQKLFDDARKSCMKEVMK